MTRREIVDKLRSFKTCWHTLSYEKMESYFEEMADAVEALPDPKAGARPDLHGDCPISLKAAIGAGARIVIEPANPEAD